MRNIKIRLVIYLTLLSLVLGQGVNAVDIQNVNAGVCPDFIVLDAEQLKTEFYKQLEEQNESAEPSSNRIGNIFSAYRDFQKRLKDITGQNFIYQQTTAGNTDLGAACLIYYRNTDAIVKEVVTQSFQQVLERKGTFRLNERFDSILDKMDELQEEYHDTRVNINNFHDKFPCFVSKCTTN